MERDGTGDGDLLTWNLEWRQEKAAEVALYREELRRAGSLSDTAIEEKVREKADTDGHGLVRGPSPLSALLGEKQPCSLHADCNDTAKLAEELNQLYNGLDSRTVGQYAAIDENLKQDSLQVVICDVYLCQLLLLLIIDKCV